jgi:hypothetical protein
MTQQLPWRSAEAKIYVDTSVSLHLPNADLSAHTIVEPIQTFLEERVSEACPICAAKAGLSSIASRAMDVDCLLCGPYRITFEALAAVKADIRQLPIRWAGTSHASSPRVNVPRYCELLFCILVEPEFQEPACRLPGEVPRFLGAEVRIPRRHRRLCLARVASVEAY